MLAEYFEPMPLPRGRAFASVSFAAFAFLSFAGVLSFSTASPDTMGGLAAAPYWASVFAFHFAAFLGAALIGAFPRLARRDLKLAWVAVTALLAVGGLLSWALQRPSGAPLAPGGWIGYLPGVAALVVGCSFRELAANWTEDEQGKANDEPGK